MVVRLPSTAARHMIGRFSYGYNAKTRTAVAEAGGAQEWFDDQLHPTRVPDHATDAMEDWFPDLRSSSRTRQAVDRDGRRNSWELSMDLVRWTILRRIHSNRQLFETIFPGFSQGASTGAMG
jgi:hypothetical protein